MTQWTWCLLCLSFATTTLQSPVYVSVYYESLCYDSILFITKQMYPTWLKLTSTYLTLDFLPYGKASQQRSSDGHWNFICQHGSRECDGNKVQACALHYLRSNQSQQVEFNNCVMSNEDPPSAGPKCARILNISYQPIEECSTGLEGEELLAALGNRTHNFKPPITFVPTIAFNGVYTEDDQYDSLKNVMAVVCRHLTGDKPAACT